MIRNKGYSTVSKDSPTYINNKYGATSKSVSGLKYKVKSIKRNERNRRIGNIKKVGNGVSSFGNKSINVSTGIITVLLMIIVLQLVTSIYNAEDIDFSSEAIFNAVASVEPVDTFPNLDEFGFVTWAEADGTAWDKFWSMFQNFVPLCKFGFAMFNYFFSCIKWLWDMSGILFGLIK